MMKPHRPARRVVNRNLVSIENIRDFPDSHRISISPGSSTYRRTDDVTTEKMVDVVSISFAHELLFLTQRSGW